MRNFFHILIGCTIMYTVGFLTGFTEFNITFGNIFGESPSFNNRKCCFVEKTTFIDFELIDLPRQNSI